MGVWDPNKKGLMAHFKLLQASTGILFLGLGYMAFSTVLGGTKHENKQDQDRRT